MTSLQQTKDNEAHKQEVQSKAKAKVITWGVVWLLLLFTIGPAGGAFTFLVILVAGCVWAAKNMGIISAAFTTNAIRDKTAATTHGSADWAGLWDMLEMGAFKPKGAKAQEFALASCKPSSWPDEEPFNALDRRVRVGGHVVTVAPTGTGKGVACVIPTLLEYDGSAIVIDVKGENAAVTARARRELGQEIYTIDPFGITGQPKATYNPLAVVDVTNPDCVATSAAIADALVMVNPEAQGADHFDETARKLLQGLILYVCALYPENLRTLAEVRRALTLTPNLFKGMIEHMASDESIAYSIPARVAALVLSVGDRELGSILSTAQRHTEFLDDPRICEALGDSEHAADLRLVKQVRMTVYIVLPAHVIRQNARFMRSLSESFSIALLRIFLSASSSKSLYIISSSVPRISDSKSSFPSQSTLRGSSIETSAFVLLFLLRYINISFSIHLEAYVASLIFFSGLYELIAFIRPIVPIEIKSSTPTPVLSNFFAMYTTSLRLCSISCDFAPFSS